MNRLRARSENPRVLQEVAPSPAAGTNGIGGGSVCRYRDALVEHIEFEITRRSESKVDEVNHDTSGSDR